MLNISQSNPEANPEHLQLDQAIPQEMLDDIVNRPEIVASYIHDTYMKTLRSQVERTKTTDFKTLEQNWDMAQWYLKELVAVHNGSTLEYIASANEGYTASCPVESKIAESVFDLLSSQVEAHELASQYIDY